MRRQFFTYLRNYNVVAIQSRNFRGTQMILQPIIIEVNPIQQIHRNTVSDTNCTSSKALVDNKSSWKLSEKHVLLKLKDDPNIFGNSKDDSVLTDLGDIKENEYSEFIPSAVQKKTINEYAAVIKQLVSKRKIKEAIDVLEIRAIRDDRVKPTSYLYNLVIDACAKVGYTKKAFSLYNDMKKRGLKVHPSTYTALLNACANSPWPTTDGLSRAKHLRNIMIEKGYQPNLTNYNAMLKAFGRGADLETVFSLVDEMSSKNFKIKSDTFAFLLQACISDSEAGFRHALLVWRKLIEKKIRPSLFNYNLLLRCVRDCGLGDIKITDDVIKQLISSNEDHLVNANDKIKLLSNQDKTFQTNTTVLETIPNLIAPTPHLGNVLVLEEVTKAQDRLLLIGGCTSLLQNMKNNNCVPNIKTFTLLLDSIPNTNAAESQLLKHMRQSNIKPDIDFYNMLIKRRHLRFDYEGGKEIFSRLLEENLMPNLITYGVLALGCATKQEALCLLEEMKTNNYRINIEILGAMLKQATHLNKFSYLIELMEICVTENITPSSIFLDCLALFKKKCKNILNDKHDKSTTFKNNYKLFKNVYKDWLNKIQVETEEHPWQQYRQTTDTNTKNYKDKHMSSNFKTQRQIFKSKKNVNKLRSK